MDNGVINKRLYYSAGYTMENGIKLTNGFNLSNGSGNGGGTANGIDVAHNTIAPKPGSDLEKWIDVDPPGREKIIDYMTQCALPSTKSVTLNYRGTKFIYNGIFNLGPGWANGTGQMTTDEQEKVSACLLARSNAASNTRYIYVVGPWTNWNTMTTTENNTFFRKEANFFGNLFASTPKAYLCVDSPSSDVDLSDAVQPYCQVRACRKADGSCDCGIITPNVNCRGGAVASCTSASVSIGSGNYTATYMSSCTDSSSVTWNNVITTYIAPYTNGQACFTNFECNDGRCVGGYCADNSNASSALTINNNSVQPFGWSLNQWDKDFYKMDLANPTTVRLINLGASTSHAVFDILDNTGNSSIYWSRGVANSAPFDNEVSADLPAGNSQYIMVKSDNDVAGNYMIAKRQLLGFYEAENGTKTGSAANASVSGFGACSGGYVVKDVGGSGNGRLAINNVSAPSTGTYKLTIRYMNGDTTSRTALMKVNGGAATTLTFPSTGASAWWANPVPLRVNVSLNSGSSNTIEFYNTGSANCPHFDSFAVSTN